MHFLYDFIPVILFFVAFKLFGIYVATTVGIVVTALQVLITTIFKRKLDKQQLITLLVFVVFGGMTLYFHNPLFIKWKPTVIYWIFAIVLLVSQFIGEKTIMQRMLEAMMEKSQVIVPSGVWKKVNAAWGIFFALLGCLNLYVAYNYSTDAWVNFKLYGTLGLVFVFSLIQSVYLSKNMTEIK